MKLVEALAFAKDQLAQAGVPSPEADSYWLLAHALQTSKAELLTSLTLGLELTPAQLTQFKLDLENRTKRVPLQHITGASGFRKLELKVGPGVFIPRYETEQVAQIAIDLISSSSELLRVVDVGTGSGAIAIAIATETNAEVYAIEADTIAAKYARENIEANQANVALLLGRFEQELPKLKNLDLIVSNPPYIPISAVPLEPEVRDFDPELALYSGDDGLDAIRELIALSPISLRIGGSLILEHADGQSDSVRELLLTSGYGDVLAHPDATGRLRAVSAVRRS